jgi:hypothetical protein
MYFMPFTKYNRKKDEVGETCSMSRTDEKHNHEWKTPLKETDQWIRRDWNVDCIHLAQERNHTCSLL